MLSLRYRSQIFLTRRRKNTKNYDVHQRYAYRVLQTIQMKLVLLCVWGERAVLGMAKQTPLFLELAGLWEKGWVKMVKISHKNFRWRRLWMTLTCLTSISSLFVSSYTKLLIYIKLSRNPERVVEKGPTCNLFCPLLL